MQLAVKSIAIGQSGRLDNLGYYAISICATTL